MIHLPCPWLPGLGAGGGEAISGPASRHPHNLTAPRTQAQHRGRPLAGTSGWQRGSLKASLGPAGCAGPPSTIANASGLLSPGNGEEVQGLLYLPRRTSPRCHRNLDPSAPADAYWARASAKPHVSGGFPGQRAEPGTLFSVNGKSILNRGPGDALTSALMRDGPAPDVVMRPDHMVGSQAPMTTCTMDKNPARDPMGSWSWRQEGAPAHRMALLTPDSCSCCALRLVFPSCSPRAH